MRYEAFSKSILYICQPRARKTTTLTTTVATVIPTTSFHPPYGKLKCGKKPTFWLLSQGLLALPITQHAYYPWVVTAFGVRRASMSIPLIVSEKLQVSRIYAQLPPSRFQRSQLHPYYNRTYTGHYYRNNSYCHCLCSMLWLRCLYRFWGNDRDHFCADCDPYHLVPLSVR